MDVYVECSECNKEAAIVDTCSLFVLKKVMENVK
jgi:hypothetical protein